MHAVSRPGLVVILTCSVLVLTSHITAGEHTDHPPNDGFRAPRKGATFVERPDEELVILQIILGPYLLRDGVLAYATPEGVRLPLGEVCAALGFPIEIDPARGRASGWFLAENRRLVLDTIAGTAHVEGRPAAFEPAQIEIHRTDIFIDPRMIEAWLPIRLEVNIASLRVTVHPSEPLPIENRAERHRRWARVRRDSSEPRRHDLPRPTFELLGWPSIDATLGITYQQTGAGSRQRTTQRALQLDTRAVGDLLGMTTRLALNASARDGGASRATGDVASRLQLSMERADPDGRLLGPLRATRFTIGDLRTPESLLVAREEEARGLEVTNLPLERPDAMDHTTISGQAPPGWEAELYRNGELIDYQVVTSPEGYRFDDAPLLYGFNLFRVDLYGPHGERRSETERIMIGPSLIREGELLYRFGLYDEHRPSSESEPDPSRQTGFSPRISASVERGLTRRLSVRAATDSILREGDRHTYATFGVRTSAASVFSQVDVIADVEAGWAAQLMTQARVGSFDVQARHAEIFGLASDLVAPGEGSVRGHTSCTIEGRFPTSAGPSLGLRGNAAWSRMRSGAQEITLVATGSHRWRTVSISESLSAARATRPDGVGSSVSSAVLRLSRSGSTVGLRSSLHLDLLPETELKSLELRADWRLGRRRMIRLSAQRSLESDRKTSLGLSMIWRAEHLSISASARVTPSQGASIGLSFSTGALHDPIAGSWQVGPEPTTESAAVVARVFLDHDLDQVFDPGTDEPIAGARFHGVGRASTRSSDSEGRVLLSRLSPLHPITLGLNLASLEDPYWIPTRKPETLVLRPGQVYVLEVPVAVTGEVEGTIWLEEGTERQPAANVLVQALTPNGRVAAETRTAYDGLYILDQVPPGQYAIRIDPEQLNRLHLTSTDPVSIELGQGGEIIRQIDLELTRRSTAPHPSATGPAGDSAGAHTSGCGDGS